MVSIKMITFCKSLNCPSSQALLAFENGGASATETGRINGHLDDCEFCASEVEFYSHYPQAEEPVATVEIPVPLYELAHSILNIRHKDFTALNQLFSEKVIG